MPLRGWGIEIEFIIPYYKYIKLLHSTKKERHRDMNVFKGSSVSIEGVDKLNLTMMIFLLLGISCIVLMKLFQNSDLVEVIPIVTFLLMFGLMMYSLESEEENKKTVNPVMDVNPHVMEHAWDDKTFSEDELEEFEKMEPHVDMEVMSTLLALETDKKSIDNILNYKKVLSEIRRNVSPYTLAQYAFEDDFLDDSEWETILKISEESGVDVAGKATKMNSKGTKTAKHLFLTAVQEAKRIHLEGRK